MGVNSFIPTRVTNYTKGENCFICSELTKKEYPQELIWENVHRRENL